MTGRRVALHIGLDRIAEPDGRRRGLRLQTLNGALDAARFATRTEEAGFDVTCLRDEEAKVDAVRHHLDAARTLRAGDLLLVTYAGHGTQLVDTSGDEDLDETWELWDGTMLDDEIGALLAAIPADVAVVLVSDSCHSASVFKAFPDDRTDAPSLSDPVADPPAVAAKPLGSLFRSDVVVVSACPDEGVAYEYTGWGLLTGALLATWDDAPDVAWHPLLRQAFARLRRVEPRQSPRLSATDGGLRLLDAPAFSARGRVS